MTIHLTLLQLLFQSILSLAVISYSQYIVQAIEQTVALL